MILTAKELSKIFKNVKHPKEAQVEFYINDVHYEIERIAQFNVVPTVTIKLKKSKKCCSLDK